MAHFMRSSSVISMSFRQIVVLILMIILCVSANQCTIPFYNDIIAISSLDGHLTLLDSRTGSTIWSWDTGGPLIQSVSYDSHHPLPFQTGLHNRDGPPPDDNLSSSLYMPLLSCDINGDLYVQYFDKDNSPNTNNYIKLGLKLDHIVSSSPFQYEDNTTVLGSKTYSTYQIDLFTGESIINKVNNNHTHDSDMLSYIGQIPLHTHIQDDNDISIQYNSITHTNTTIYNNTHDHNETHNINSMDLSSLPSSSSSCQHPIRLSVIRTQYNINLVPSDTGNTNDNSINNDDTTDINDTITQQSSLIYSRLTPSLYISSSCLKTCTYPHINTSNGIDTSSQSSTTLLRLNKDGTQINAYSKHDNVTPIWSHSIISPVVGMYMIRSDNTNPNIHDTSSSLSSSSSSSVLRSYSSHPLQLTTMMLHGVVEAQYQHDDDDDDDHTNNDSNIYYIDIDYSDQDIIKPHYDGNSMKHIDYNMLQRTCSPYILSYLSNNNHDNDDSDNNNDEDDILVDGFNSIKTENIDVYYIMCTQYIYNNTYKQYTNYIKRLQHYNKSLGSSKNTLQKPSLPLPLPSYIGQGKRQQLSLSDLEPIYNALQSLPVLSDLLNKNTNHRNLRSATTIPQSAINTLDSNAYRSYNNNNNNGVVISQQRQQQRQQQQHQASQYTSNNHDNGNNNTELSSLTIDYFKHIIQSYIDTNIKLHNNIDYLLQHINTIKQQQYNIYNIIIQYKDILEQYGIITPHISPLLSSPDEYIQHSLVTTTTTTTSPSSSSPLTPSLPSLPFNPSHLYPLPSATNIFLPPPFHNHEPLPSVDHDSDINVHIVINTDDYVDTQRPQSSSSNERPSSSSSSQQPPYPNSNGSNPSSSRHEVMPKHHYDYFKDRTSSYHSLHSHNNNPIQHAMLVIIELLYMIISLLFILSEHTNIVIIICVYSIGYYFYRQQTNKHRSMVISICLKYNIPVPEAFEDYISTHLSSSLSSSAGRLSPYHNRRESRTSGSGSMQLSSSRHHHETLERSLSSTTSTTTTSTFHHHHHHHIQSDHYPFSQVYPTPINASTGLPITPYGTPYASAFPVHTIVPQIPAFVPESQQHQQQVSSSSSPSSSSTSPISDSVHNPSSDTAHDTINTNHITLSTQHQEHHISSHRMIYNQYLHHHCHHHHSTIPSLDDIDTLSHLSRATGRSLLSSSASSAVSSSGMISVSSSTLSSSLSNALVSTAAILTDMSPQSYRRRVGGIHHHSNTPTPMPTNHHTFLPQTLTHSKTDHHNTLLSSSSSPSSGGHIVPPHPLYNMIFYHDKSNIQSIPHHNSNGSSSIIIDHDDNTSIQSSSLQVPPSAYSQRPSLSSSYQHRPVPLIPSATSKPLIAPSSRSQTTIVTYNDGSTDSDYDDDDNDDDDDDDYNYTIDNSNNNNNTISYNNMNAMINIDDVDDTCDVPAVYPLTQQQQYYTTATIDHDDNNNTIVSTRATSAYNTTHNTHHESRIITTPQHYYDGYIGDYNDIEQLVTSTFTPSSILQTTTASSSSPSSPSSQHHHHHFHHYHHHHHMATTTAVSSSATTAMMMNSPLYQSSPVTMIHDANGNPYHFIPISSPHQPTASLTSSPSQSHIPHELLPHDEIGNPITSVYIGIDNQYHPYPPRPSFNGSGYDLPSSLSSPLTHHPKNVALSKQQPTNTLYDPNLLPQLLYTPHRDTITYHPSLVTVAEEGNHTKVVSTPSSSSSSSHISNKHGHDTNGPVVTLPITTPTHHNNNNDNDKYNDDKNNNLIIAEQSQSIQPQRQSRNRTNTPIRLVMDRQYAAIVIGGQAIPLYPGRFRRQIRIGVPANFKVPSQVIGQIPHKPDPASISRSTSRTSSSLSTMSLSSSSSSTDQQQEQQTDILGQGGFGTVRVCTDVIDGGIYAIKQVVLLQCPLPDTTSASSSPHVTTTALTPSLSAHIFGDNTPTGTTTDTNTNKSIIDTLRTTILVDSDNCEIALREARALAQLDHPNIVRYFHSWIEDFYPQDVWIHDDDGNSSSGSDYDDDNELSNVNVNKKISTKKQQKKKLNKKKNQKRIIKKKKNSSISSSNNTNNTLYNKDNIFDDPSQIGYPYQHNHYSLHSNGENSSNSNLDISHGFYTDKTIENSMGNNSIHLSDQSLVNNNTRLTTSNATNSFGSPFFTFGSPQESDCDDDNYYDDYDDEDEDDDISVSSASDDSGDDSHSRPQLPHQQQKSYASNLFGPGSSSDDDDDSNGSCSDTDDISHASSLSHISLHTSEIRSNNAVSAAVTTTTTTTTTNVSFHSKVYKNIFSQGSSSDDDDDDDDDGHDNTNIGDNHNDSQSDDDSMYPSYIMTSPSHSHRQSRDKTLHLDSKQMTDTSPETPRTPASKTTTTTTTALTNHTSKTTKTTVKTIHTDSTPRLNRKQQKLYDEYKRYNMNGFVFYLQMQYCAYGTLRGYLDKRNNINVVECIYLFEQILLGTHHIHTRGLIHRDLKPDNILFDDVLHVRIGDFGLCKIAPQGLSPDLIKQYSLLLSGSGSSSSSATCPAVPGPTSPIDNTTISCPGNSPALVTSPIQQQASLALTIPPDSEMSIGVGSFLYASPEQLRTPLYTTYTDLYSLGIILLECFSSFSSQSERLQTLYKARSGHVKIDIGPFINLYLPDDQLSKNTPSSLDLALGIGGPQHHIPISSPSSSLSSLDQQLLPSSLGQHQYISPHVLSMATRDAEAVRQLIIRLMDNDPFKRPTAQDILASQWINIYRSKYHSYGLHLS